MKFIIAAVALLLAVTSIVYAIQPPPSGNPLPKADVVDEQFTGEVEERIKAGSYVYLRVRDESGQSHWVAALSMLSSTAAARFSQRVCPRDAL